MATPYRYRRPQHGDRGRLVHPYDQQLAIPRSRHRPRRRGTRHDRRTRRLHHRRRPLQRQQQPPLARPPVRPATRPHRGTGQVRLDEGIAGNEVLTDATLGGPSALNRLARDVLARRGLTDVILLEGINDLRGAGASADQVIAGYQKIIVQVHAAGARIFGATLTPVEGCDRYTTARLDDFLR